MSTGPEPTVLPMFPLGAVLLPGGLLPLHVFEERYKQLTADCLASDRDFGVVLIERGSEVGGGDVRTGIGTVAHIVEAAEVGDGRLALGCVGTRRIRVRRWLEDDPYPRAEVEDWPDPAPAGDLGDALQRVEVALRRVLGLRGELGEHAAPATVDLPDDPAALCYHATLFAGLGPMDSLDVLAAPSPEARLELVAALLADAEDTLRRRLDLGG